MRRKINIDEIIKKKLNGNFKCDDLKKKRIRCYNEGLKMKRKREEKEKRKLERLDKTGAQLKRKVGRPRKI